MIRIFNTVCYKVTIRIRFKWISIDPGIVNSISSGLYTIGYAVNADDSTPEGMIHMRVPEQRYAVITARGEMPGALVETWMEIWEANLSRAFATDFEIHDPATPGEVEIWLSLK